MQNEPERAQREAAEHRKKREEKQQNEEKGSQFGNESTGSCSHQGKRFLLPAILTASVSSGQLLRELERERTRTYDPIQVKRLEKLAKAGNEEIRQLKSSINSVDQVGNTVLHKLIKNHDKDVQDIAAQLLLADDLAFDVNIQDDREKTILHLAIEQSNARVAEAIIERCPKPRLVDENNKTALSSIDARFD
jgi:ankyrin repeat protein